MIATNATSTSGATAADLVIDSPPADWWRWAAEQIGGQRAAARLIHVDERTIRRWCAGERQGPWSAAMLLQAIIVVREDPQRALRMLQRMLQRLDQTVV